MSLRQWTVYRPHPLVARGSELWTVDDDIPGIPGANRRMTIVRRADRSLLFFNAIPVPDETLRQVRALGTPGALIAPNQYHALDAASFAEKLQVPCFMPRPALRPLEERVRGRPVDELPADSAIQLLRVDGFRTEEIVLIAHRALIVADLITNVGHGPGLTGLMMRLIGFTGPEPKLPPPVQRRVQVDRPAVKRFFAQLAERDDLELLIPSHGAVLAGDVRAALRRLADRH